MPDQDTDCQKEAIVHQYLKVQAQITARPHVKHGKPKVCCIDSDIRPNWGCEKESKVYHKLCRKPGESDNKCTFTVTQVLCVEIPISVDVDVDVDQGIVHCGRPSFGPCKPPCDEREDIDQIEEDNTSNTE